MPPVSQFLIMQLRMNSAAEARRSEVIRTAAGTTAMIAGSTAAAAVGIPVAGTAALGAAGFSATGIVAGSIAAGAQATIGNVAAGSMFALFQSIGATGGLAILGPIGLIAGAVVLTISVTAAVIINLNVKNKHAPPLRKVPLTATYFHV